MPAAAPQRRGQPYSSHPKIVPLELRAEQEHKHPPRTEPVKRLTRGRCGAPTHICEQNAEAQGPPLGAGAISDLPNHRPVSLDQVPPDTFFSLPLDQHCQPTTLPPSPPSGNGTGAISNLLNHRPESLDQVPPDTFFSLPLDQLHQLTTLAISDLLNHCRHSLDQVPPDTFFSLSLDQLHQLTPPPPFGK